MHPGVITFTNGASSFQVFMTQSSINWKADGDINIKSGKDISFQADGSVYMGAGMDFHIRKDKGATGAIRLNDEVHISGIDFQIVAEPCALAPIPAAAAQPADVDMNQVNAAKAIAGSAPRVVDAANIESSGVSPGAMAAATIASAASPSTLSANTFSPCNTPKVKLKPILKVKAD